MTFTSIIIRVVAELTALIVAGAPPDFLYTSLSASLFSFPLETDERCSLKVAAARRGKLSEEIVCRRFPIEFVLSSQSGDRKDGFMSLCNAM